MELPYIPIERLLIIFVPLLVVVYIHFRWKTGYLNSLYAIGRMVLQLAVIGYFLTFVFELNKAWIIILVLVIMTVAASIISLRNFKLKKIRFYIIALLSLVIGGGSVLYISTHLVLQLTPWYLPRFFVPLAGMTFANAMNSMSVAMERFESELNENKSIIEARTKAYKAGLIPVTNSFIAVGLVSIPGMMTGQILSGISPLIAARYQIIIMCMVYASSGISTAFLLWQTGKQFKAKD